MVRSLKVVFAAPDNVPPAQLEGPLAVKANAPLSAPPPRFNPAMDTSEVSVAVPAFRIAVSAGPGTSGGAQLAASFQFALPPNQVAPNAWPVKPSVHAMTRDDRAASAKTFEPRVGFRRTATLLEALLLGAGQLPRTKRRSLFLRLRGLLHAGSIRRGKESTRAI